MRGQVTTGQAQDTTVVIQIAPQTIVLGAPVSAVTVHAQIPYSSVVGTSVTLSGIPASATFPDSRGELVAKFRFSAVSAIVSPPSATLVLNGLTKDGGSFTGQQTVVVGNR